MWRVLFSHKSQPFAECGGGALRHPEWRAAAKDPVLNSANAAKVYAPRGPDHCRTLKAQCLNEVFRISFAVMCNIEINESIFGLG